MGFQDYISEIEATSITGVSGATLNRFAEAGYLQIETDSDGLRLFSKAALVDLFGFKDLQKYVDKSLPFTSDKAADDVVVKEVKLAGRENLESPKAEIKKPEAENIAAAASPTAPQSSPEPIRVAEAAIIPGMEKEPSGAKDTESAAARYEIAKLKQIVEMQDKLLDMKDKEIRDLKEQRDWLKERVHRFEEKSDRDQLLLLSETQLIRKLVTTTLQPKKSAVQLALEWFGFAKPSNNPVIHSGLFEISDSNAAQNSAKDSGANNEGKTSPR